MKPQKIKFDVNKLSFNINNKFELPLVLKSSPYPEEKEEQALATLRMDMYGFEFIPENSDKYVSKYFCADYIEWLLHTGYIREVKAN